MKTIRVVAAVICDSIEHKTKIFSTARGYGEFKGGWEFPGGKVEEGETPQEALKREIMGNLRTGGNFPVERLNPERLRSRQLSEKSVRNWIPQSGSET